MASAVASIRLSAAEIEREDIDYSESVPLISESDYSNLSRLLGTSIALDDRHIPVISCKPEVSKKGEESFLYRSGIHPCQTHRNI